jgi:hypothetical protein
MSGLRPDKISAHVRSGRNSHSRPEVPWYGTLRYSTPLRRLPTLPIYNPTHPEQVPARGGGRPGEQAAPPAGLQVCAGACEASWNGLGRTPTSTLGGELGWGSPGWGHEALGGTASTARAGHEGRGEQAAPLAGRQGRGRGVAGQEAAGLKIHPVRRPAAGRLQVARWIARPVGAHKRMDRPHVCPATPPLPSNAPRRN